MDPIEVAVQEGEDRAEREWLREHGQPLPEHLMPPGCRSGDHILTMDSDTCIYCGSET